MGELFPNRKDCFAKVNEKCTLLNGNYFCSVCPFYKTKQQYAQDRLKYFTKEKEF